LLIGVLSDTHDKADAMAAAIQLLAAHGAEFFIHCGDVGGQRVLDHLAGLRSAFVWGNNDWDRLPLQRYAEKLGIACYGSRADLELDGKRFAVIHGDDFRLRQQLIEEQEYDYLLLGHSHVKEDRRSGRTRIVNPGALYRAREKTVATIDTRTDAVTFLVVEI
jgi:putative phosphoesterase